jgi:recombination protein RecA
MGRKKKVVAKPTVGKLTVAEILQGLHKDFGDDIFVSGESIINRKRMVIPLSPKLDIGLGGGIPEGYIAIATGPPKVGKTTTWLDFASTCQLPEYDHPKHGPRHIFFHNIEMRLKERDLKGVHHLNLDTTRFTCIESSPGNFLTAEKHANIMYRLIHEVPGSVFVADSFSALCTQGRLDKDIGEQGRDRTTTILSDLLTKAQPALLMNDSILCGVTHLVANTSGMGMGRSETGGVKLQYHSDIKIFATHSKPIMVGAKKDDPDSGTQIGQTIYWRVNWSALGPPGQKVEGQLRYGYGLDHEGEMIDIGVDLGIIAKGGSWYTFDDGTKVQGSNNARQHLIDNPDLYKIIYDNYRNMMGFTNES